MSMVGYTQSRDAASHFALHGYGRRQGIFRIDHGTLATYQRSPDENSCPVAEDLRYQLEGAYLHGLIWQHLYLG